MLANEETLYSHADYFALEEQAEVKSEYYQGHVVAMTGASLNHNRLVRNTTFAINDQLTGQPCEIFIGDVRVWVEKKDVFAYPDVMVVCGSPALMENRTDTLTNPKVIIKVLSPSTMGYDRGEKFQAYWSLDSFEEYVLVDQHQIRVEYFRRVDKTLWELRIFTKLDDSLTLQSIDTKISLHKIYQDVRGEM
ncbi:MAG: Uma2 family endonuclease [Chloroflexota bacterium]|nr:Uma2 family endonuclease [Chloroflexota bacterium]